MHGLVDVHVPRGIHDPELSLVCLQQCVIQCNNVIGFTLTRGR